LAFSKHLLKRLTFLIITHTGWCKSYSDLRSESMSKDKCSRGLLW
jgi:hypothetical protein